MPPASAVRAPPAQLRPVQATPHTGPALISAPWPAADAAVDAAADAQFEALQAAVRAVRNARAEYGVEPGRKVAATFRVASPELRAALEAEAPVLALLAKLDQEQVGGGLGGCGGVGGLWAEAASVPTSRCCSPRLLASLHA